MPDLNHYASTIQLVFEQLAKSYSEENNPFGLADATSQMQRAVDADTCAEIISVAEEIDMKGIERNDIADDGPGKGHR